MKINKMIYQKDRKMELLYTEKYKNYQYYILNLGTHPTAYVEISKGHKLYNKNYNDIDINVHGGLTYSSNELMGISSNNWYIGWDYAHCNDYCGYEEYIPENIRTYGKKWTTEEIIEECKNAIDQIVDFKSEKILEEEKKIPEKHINNYGDLIILGQQDNWLEPTIETGQKINVQLNPYVFEAINENFKDIENKIYEMIDYLDYLKNKGE